MSRLWRIYQFLIPFCQLTFQTGDPQRHLPARVQKKSIDFAVCFTVVELFIQVKFAGGSGHPNAFSQFQGLPDEIQACAAWCLLAWLLTVLVLSCVVTSYLRVYT